MRATVREFEGCFSVALTAETVEDMATLVRMGMNAKTEVRHFTTTVNADAGTEAHIVFGKHRRADNAIPRRR